MRRWSAFDRISIPADMATRFVRGGLDHRDWIVWNNTIHSRKNEELRLDHRGIPFDKDFVTLPRDAMKSGGDADRLSHCIARPNG